MLSRLTDKLILKPSNHPLPTPEKSRHLIDFEDQHLEIWKYRYGDPDMKPDLFVLKFSGAGGRAEQATFHPLDYWKDLRAELWAMNAPGFGGSPGRASIQNLAAAGRTAYLAMRKIAGKRPILITGNSLGTTTALHVASTCEVAGLILRNPPPLRQMIVGHYGWWNLWVIASLVARQIPHQLNSILNAKKTKVPAVFVSSGKDRLVPPRYHHQVIESYGGEKRILRLDEAGHFTDLTTHESKRYGQLLTWLRGHILADSPQ